MLLTLTTTHVPATDLGFLLHKNPARAQSFGLSFGKAHVFYPERKADRCTVALLLDIDPVGLSRRVSASLTVPLQPYVNDRPYVASSFMSVAIAQVFGAALGGRSQERQELADTPIHLEATLAAISCRGGAGLLGRLFEPLGYELEAERHPLDELHPEWEPSPLYSVRLRGRVRLRDLLAHLYVLIPVLDDEKHYWVGDDEVEKLLRHGEGWLGAHPERELIALRYLKHRRSLVREALARLADEDAPDPDSVAEVHAQQEASLEQRISLNDERLGAVLAALRVLGARRVLDLGCGEGKLLKLLLDDRAFERIVGLDVSHRCLEIASDKLGLEPMPFTLRLPARGRAVFARSCSS
jgi:3' terminal RNA ribose 2'-O-methyltransferase Hen1